MLLFQACKFMSEADVPLYITEVGVADSHDVLRNEMLITYFAQVCLLIYAFELLPD